MFARIGKYHVIRAAGSGGFGTVYEGYDVELDRNVAIKICTGDESQLERFRREARVVSQLKHRNVALVYDFGYDDDAGVHYLVEEFLSGVDLDKKLEERDRLPPALRLRYLMGIAQGLAFVHERGLIHRDLSPRNVRVLHDHTIKLMDFGLAKDVTDSTLTLIGDNFGTIGYTAPEQVTGMRTVDHRTDLFSFGVIAYELLTLTNPFMADNMGNFIHKIHHHVPRSLAELWPECPPELAEAVHKCMEKAPEDRYGSCSEILPILKSALRYLRDHDVSAPYAPPSASDEFDEILDAVGEQISLADGGRRTGDVDSGKLTSNVDGARVRPTRPALDTPMPIAPSTKPAAGKLAAASAALRRSGLPGYLVGVVGAAVLAILVFATMRPGDGADAPEIARAAPPMPREAPASAATGEIRFELSSRSTGMPEKPSVQLLATATLPDGMDELSHCYVLRTPGWTYGDKIRRECAGEVFRHVDRVDVEAGERYAYRVQLANAAGEVWAESSESSVVAGD